MKAREFWDYLVRNFISEEENITEISELRNNKQTLFKKTNFEKGTYLLTEFASDYEIRRKNAARITHVFIHDILNISDVNDTTLLAGAGRLKDLYDCRVCVADITQMYVRGIMEAFVFEPVLLFGGEEMFTPEEARNIVQNIKSIM